MRELIAEEAVAKAQTNRARRVTEAEAEVLADEG